MNVKGKLLAAAAAIGIAATVGGGFAVANATASHTAAVDTAEAGDTPDAAEPGDTPDAPDAADGQDADDDAASGPEAAATGATVGG